MAGVVHGRFGGMFGSNSNGSSDKSPLARTPADTTLTPIDTLKSNNQKTADQPHTSVLGHIGNAAKDVGKAVVKGGEAVVKPIADVATGQGGKAAHDTAQLTSDISGGAVNQFARGVAEVPKGIAADIAAGSSDPYVRAEGIKEQKEAQIKAFGTTDSGTIAKKIIASTVGTGAMVVGGGELGGAKATIEAGGAALAKKAAADAAIGAVSNTAGTETQNPNASGKELLKSAVVGGVVGGVAPLVVKGVSSKIAGILGHDTPKPNPALTDILGKDEPKAPAVAPKTMDNVKALPAEIADAGKGAPAAPGELPSIISQVPKAALGDMKAAPLARNFVVNKYQELIKPVQEAAKGMSEGDIKKLENIELPNNPDPQAAVEHLNRIASTADNPEQFHKVVQAMREGYDARLASDQALGRDVGVRNNYLPHLFDTADKDTADKLGQINEAKTRIMAGNSTPGYVKPRSFDTYAEADAAGLKRQNANVLDDYTASMNRAGYEHGKQAMISALNDAHPNEVQVGKVGLGTDGKSYSELKIPGAKGVTLPEELADKYNQRAIPKDSTGPLGVYDKANGLLKYTKLGGGTFHLFTTAGTTVGQQVASLNLLKHPLENLKVVGGTLSRKVHASNMEKLASDGADHADGLSTADRMNLSGVTTKAREILGDANVGAIDKMKNSKFNVIKNIHDMVFDRQIPEAKALMFKQATAHLDANVPEDLAKMRKVASAVNNLGGINRAVEGLTPKSAKQLSRVVLATDFTEGKFRTIGNALTKFGKNSPQGKIARQMVVGKSLVFALPGLAAGVAAGTINPSDPKQLGDAFMSQILNPQLPTSWRTKPSKSNPNGTPISLKLPSTFISEIGKVIAPALDPLSPDKSSGIKDYASARLAALPSVGEQVGTNRDYFGNPIYGKDKQGKPITPGQTALNISNQVSPIPVVQGLKAASGQSIGESAANVAGFRATSDPTSAEAGHTKRITDFYNTYNKAYSDRSKIVSQMNDLVRQGNNQQAARIAQQYNTTIDARTMPFRSKYADDSYNPAFDEKFLQLKIPTTTRAFTSREKAIKASDAVLQ